MMPSLFTLMVVFFTGGPPTPNYFPSLTSAREASKKDQKEMIIFFSDMDCNTCEQAWMAYAKDMNATRQFVSTRMDKSDFDGGIFFDLLALKEVPSWVIITPDGKEKERWTGGWKDASGNPTVYDQTVAMEKNPVQKSVSTTTSTPPPSPTTTSKTIEQSTTSPVATPASTYMKDGYVIQAGYFGSESNALKLITDLDQKGFGKYQVKTTQQNGTTFYRVISKSYSSETHAMNDQKMINQSGVKTSIKKLADL